MVKAKKMSNDIKKYIKYVKKIISIHSKDKKEFIQLLTQKIIEFSNEHDSCSYQDIVDEFGSPNEVAGSYIETLDSDEIIKKLNKKPARCQDSVRFHKNRIFQRIVAMVVVFDISRTDRLFCQAG